jgi:CHAT domain-containing protein/Tfp pilus assembly protein PilF
MFTVVARTAVVAAVVAVLVMAAPAAQSSQDIRDLTPEEKVVATTFAAADSHETLRTMLTAHPWLRERHGLRGVALAAAAITRDRRPVPAERAYRNLYWLADQLNNDGFRSRALVGQGQVEGQLRGNLPQSLALTQQALVLAERADDFEAIQPALANLGILHRRLGDFDRASDYFARALSAAESLKRTDSVSRVYNNIGTMHYFQGNLALAREYFDRSLALKLTLEPTDDHTLDLANTLANIGILNTDVGDSAQAIEHLQKAVAHYERIRRLPAATLALSSLARAQISAGLFSDAQATLDRAQPIAERVGEKSALALVLFLKGLVSRERGQFFESLAFQHRSLELRVEVRDVAALSDSYNELSNLLLRMQRPVDAEAEARRALELAGPRRLLSQQAGAQFQLAQALDAQGRRSEALPAYEAAIETVEQIRERALGENAARQVFMRERLGPYTGLASLHARSGRAWEAMQTIEQARARSLLDILSFGRPPTTILNDALRRRERDVTNALAFATQELKAAERNPETAPEEKSRLDAARARSREAYEAFKQELYAAHPRLRLIRGDAPVITPTALNEIVPAGTAAVEFVIDPDYAWAYLTIGGAEGATVTAHRLSTPPAALVALGEQFARQVSARDLGFASTSRQLYAALFSDLDFVISTAQRLIVVPDGALWNVPFQALTTPRGKYLVEERAVSYTPSLSALSALRARSDARPDRATRLVALGDPDEDGAGAAESVRVGAGSLPEARREVQALGQLYGRARSTVLVGSAATEAALRAAAADASVLHVASHGVLDDHGPMFSHLRLAPNRGDDGRLEAWEVADLDLSADLVVLSACQTARGAFGGGEGVIGLSWALLAAGASTAVLSQWEVDSASTTALMLAFHQQRLNGDASVDATPAALRTAAVTMLKDPKYRHPFYWAGFIVMGS